MYLARNALALALAFSMSPGLVEFADDGVHLVLEGHSDHAEDEDACPEHGCTPASHHCGCCTSIAVAGAPLAAPVPSSISTVEARSFVPAVPGPEGALRRLRRPPRA